MYDDIDYDFIAEKEGKEVKIGYVPDSEDSKSGVTIATGFDLGQHNEHDLQRFDFMDTLYKKLLPYLGLKKQAAVDFLKKHPLTISDYDAIAIDVAVRRVKVDEIKKNYRRFSIVEFDDLPREAQTVIVSVGFQYGTHMERKAMKFWKRVTVQDWEGTVKELRNFKDGHPSRRKKEARYLQKMINRDKKNAK